MTVLLPGFFFALSSLAVWNHLQPRSHQNNMKFEPTVLYYNRTTLYMANCTVLHSPPIIVHGNQLWWKYKPSLQDPAGLLQIKGWSKFGHSGRHADALLHKQCYLLLNICRPKSSYHFRGSIPMSFTNLPCSQFLALFQNVLLCQLVLIPFGLQLSSKLLMLHWQATLKSTSHIGSYFRLLLPYLWHKQDAQTTR